MRGSSISARAIPMRWRWPPENSCGKRRAWSGDRPTRVSISATRSRASDPEARPCSDSCDVSIRPMLMRGLSEAKGSWNTICAIRARSLRPGAPGPFRGLPR